jgi:hypothetical protein
MQIKKFTKMVEAQPNPKMNLSERNVYKINIFIEYNLLSQVTAKK